MILRAKYSLEIGEVAVLTRVDASNVAEMAVVGVEKVAAAESEETAETTIPEDIIPEISEPESSMSEDVISEEEAA